MVALAPRVRMGFRPISKLFLRNTERAERANPTAHESCLLFSGHPIQRDRAETAIAFAAGAIVKW